jgi:hypothetical protein
MNEGEARREAPYTESSIKMETMREMKNGL